MGVRTHSLIKYVIKMILEEATWELYGYYSTDLKPKSNKHIIAACDNCGQRRILRRQSYHALCRSCAIKGNTNALGRKNISGYKHTKKTKALMSAIQKGRDFAEEHKILLHKNHADFKGENNPNWKGGISFRSYCNKFNEVYKQKIRALFGNVCFLCSKSAEDNGEALSVHHVNYNKQCGCDKSKCICVPLCKKCHAKTNGKREYWKRKIKNKLRETLLGY